MPPALQQSVMDVYETYKMNSFEEIAGNPFLYLRIIFGANSNIVQSGMALQSLSTLYDIQPPPRVGKAIDQQPL
jgi:hypothetical protein